MQSDFYLCNKCMKLTRNILFLSRHFIFGGCLRFE
jgi:hypothetical protein